MAPHDGEGQQRLDAGDVDASAYSRTTSMMDYQHSGAQPGGDSGSFTDTGREGGGADAAAAALNNNIDGILFDYYEETDARGGAKVGGQFIFIPALPCICLVSGVYTPGRKVRERATQRPTLLLSFLPLLFLSFWGPWARLSAF